MRHFYIVFLFFVLFSTQAFAVCYTSEEAEAERVLRIHTELMVIGLNCQHQAAALGFNPYEKYKQFTNRNAALFSHYETVMERYFLHNGDVYPQKAFHEFRTSLANDISKDAAIRPDGFCNAYAQRIRFAEGLDALSLQKWALNYPLSKPICGAY